MVQVLWNSWVRSCYCYSLLSIASWKHFHVVTWVYLVGWLHITDDWSGANLELGWPNLSPNVQSMPLAALIIKTFWYILIQLTSFWAKKTRGAVLVLQATKMIAVPHSCWITGTAISPQLSPQLLAFFHQNVWWNYWIWWARVKATIEVATTNWSENVKCLNCPPEKRTIRFCCVYFMSTSRARAKPNFGDHSSYIRQPNMDKLTRSATLQLGGVAVSAHFQVVQQCLSPAEISDKIPAITVLNSKRLASMTLESAPGMNVIPICFVLALVGIHDPIAGFFPRSLVNRRSRFIRSLHHLPFWSWCFCRRWVFAAF